MKKRGQLAIFFILAVIIIILGAVFLHYRDITLKEEYIEPELVPVRDYIGTCIQDVAEQGIRIIGDKGGYIEIPSSININPRASLSLDSLGILKIPYWWHDGVQAVPTEQFVKAQLEEYITKNLEFCLEEFSAFEGQYFIEEKGRIKTSVTLTEQDVIVDVNYPLEINYNLNQTQLNIEDFKEAIPIRLKKALRLATTILERENKDFFLEKLTIDLMSMNRHIPTTNIMASCTKKTWDLQNIKKRLKHLLSVNLPFVRIFNAEYLTDAYVPTPNGANTYEESYYNYHYTWEVSEESLEGLTINFGYDEAWDFDINARPRKGSVLESNSMEGTEMLSWFCLHIWHFTYDVIYPVKATITDKETEEHKGYSFNFAFKVSIDHNQPKREGFARTFFDTADRGSDEEYCADLDNEVTIFTVADTSGQYDLDDVNLSFTCGAFTCSLGRTGYLSNGAAAGLIQEMPYCVNAILRGSKDGFADAEMFIQTDTPKTYTMYLTPMKEFNNYNVVKHDLDSPSSFGNLEDGQKVSINIKALDAEFETFGIYPAQGNYPITLLADRQHTYKVTMYLMQDDDIVGGYDSEWTVDPSQVENAGQVKFHILEQGPVSEEDKFLFLSGLESYSGNIPKPELI